MQISKELAGFSGAKADDLRKAIGKKNRAAMAALKPEFVEGCRASGTSPEVIEFLWQTNEKSADYSFNKSHAACYALIAYRTAWLKANHPAEYMAALISSVMSTKDKVPFFVARCEEMGIEILPPDVNLSDHEFTVGRPGDGRESGELGNIRFGLDAVKGVGYQAVEAIKRARARGRRVHLAVGLLRARGQPHGQQEGDRGARSSAARSARPAPAARACSRCSSRPRRPARRSSRTRSSARARSSTCRTAPGGAAAPAGRRRRRRRGSPARRSPAPVHPPIPARGVRAGRAAGGGEGSDRAVRLRAPAQAAARGAARARGLPALRARGPPRQGLGDGRRDHHRGQAHPHAQRRSHDVRDARRPRGRGRDARVRQGARRARGGAGGRRGRAREGPRRPQGSRQDVPGGADGRALRALAGGDRAGARAGRARPRRDRHRARPAGASARRAAACSREARSTSSSRRSRTSRARPRCCSTSTPATGTRRLRLGEDYRVQHTPTLRAELEHALAPSCRARAAG